MVKSCWSTKSFFKLSVFLKNLKGELALAYEIYAGGILIVILIEILNDYCFILYYLATRSPLGWHHSHLVGNTDTQYLGDQQWQQCWCFRFCLVHLSVCVSTFWKLTTIDWRFCICEPCFKARIKSVKTAYVSECLGILPKNHGEILVSRCGSEQRLQQQSAPACFVRHVCSMLVL